MNARSYKVVKNGENPWNLSSGGEYNRFALIAVRGDALDNLVCWGYKEDTLQAVADNRNRDLAMLGKMIGKAEKIVDNESRE